MFKNLWRLTKFLFGKFLVFVFAVIILGGGFQLFQLTLEVDDLKKQIINLQAATCDPDDVFKTTSQSLVRVFSGGSEGSGVIVHQSGIIVTNYHVVDENFNPRIVLASGKMFTGKVYMANVEKDLAFIKIADRENMTPIRWDRSHVDKLKKLSTVYAFGYPFGSLMEGEVSAQELKFTNVRDGYTHFI